ncbi:hypothetical protein E4U56_007290, partial [Claviceps arundinis]
RPSAPAPYERSIQPSQSNDIPSESMGGGHFFELEKWLQCLPYVSALNAPNPSLVFDEAMAKAEEKTALSIPSTAGDESMQQEPPDKHKQQSSCSGPDLPPKPTAAHRPSAANLLSTSCDLTSSPNASASGNRKRRRRTGTLCWFRV